MKLYRAWSVANNFRGYNGVKIKWYSSHSDQPVVPYESVIFNYENIASAEEIEKRLEEDEGYYGGYSKEMAEDSIGELFTEAEVDELREYLTGDFRNTFQAKLFPLPMKEYQYPYRWHPKGGPMDSYMLCGEDGYDLSIPIEGLYDLEAECTPSCTPSIFPTSRITVNAPHEICQALDELSDEKRQTVSELLRMIVDDYFERKKQTTSDTRR